MVSGLSRKETGTLRKQGPGEWKECGVRLVVRTRPLRGRNLSSILRPRSTFNLVGPSLRKQRRTRIATPG